jgi:thiol:disulfide interchange protein DsbA
MAGSSLAKKMENRVWVFPALAIVTIIVGQLCKTSCSFIEGDILGIDLNIFGIVFYAVLFLAIIFYQKVYRKDWVLKMATAAAAAGVGAEIILIKFQVENNTYCPKCLISGFFFLVMFFLLARNLKAWWIALLVVLGTIFTLFTFSGSVIPSYAAETQHPVFGNGMAKTEVIVYSDYLCPACRRSDVDINRALLGLQKSARIEFVDVPIHKGSLDYSEVFLYAWFGFGNNLQKAVQVREALFQAAASKKPQSEIVSDLKSRGIPVKVDQAGARDIFRSFYNPLLRKDGVRATPTVVIVKDGNRKSYVGGNDIMKALKELQR